MSEPVLKLRPFTAMSEVGKMVLAIIVTSALWYGVSYLASLQYHVPLWEFTLIQLFFALFIVLEVWGGFIFTMPFFFLLCLVLVFLYMPIEVIGGSGRGRDLLNCIMRFEV